MRQPRRSCGKKPAQPRTSKDGQRDARRVSDDECVARNICIALSLLWSMRLKAPIPARLLSTRSNSSSPGCGSRSDPSTSGSPATPSPRASSHPTRNRRCRSHRLAKTRTGSCRPLLSSTVRRCRTRWAGRGMRGRRRRRAPERRRGIGRTRRRGGGGGGAGGLGGGDGGDGGGGGDGASGQGGHAGHGGAPDGRSRKFPSPSSRGR